MTPKSDKPDDHGGGHGKPGDPPGQSQIQVTVEDGDNDGVHKTVHAGPTPIPELLGELGLAGDLVLWLKRHGDRVMINIHELFTPENGDRFIAVRGGGVS